MRFVTTLRPVHPVRHPPSPFKVQGSSYKVRCWMLGQRSPDSESGFNVPGPTLNHQLPCSQPSCAVRLVRPGTDGGTGATSKAPNVHRPWYGGTAEIPQVPPPRSRFKVQCPASISPSITKHHSISPIITETHASGRCTNGEPPVGDAAPPTDESAPIRAYPRLPAAIRAKINFKIQPPITPFPQHSVPPRLLLPVKAGQA